MQVIEKVTLADVRAAKPKMIFYGANTCWWTHNENHLGQTPPSSEAEVQRMADVFKLNAKPGVFTDEQFLLRAREATKHRLPCDPRGGVLFQTDDIEGFLQAAIKNVTHYGKHGLRAFMAAHHENCILSFENPIPWCDRDWQAYNDALDEKDQIEKLKETL